MLTDFKPYTVLGMIGVLCRCSKSLLLFRLSECVGQLSQAERDREHWKLEYQLATIKLNKNNTQVFKF